MFGKVPIIIAQEVQGSRTIRIFRELPYKKHILQEMGEECFANIDEISRYLKTLLHRTSIEAVQGNAQSLINILAHIKNIYVRVSHGLNTMQEYMPRSLIRFYEKIDDLQKQLAQNKVNYNYNDAVMVEIDNMSEYMSTIQKKILSFWERQPEIFIRLPSHLYVGMTPDLFLSDDYFPYIMGNERLPRWMDPVLIDMMNDARKIYQTKEQTIAHKKKYTKYLTLMTRTVKGVSSEIIALIVDYMPIHIIFDLLSSVSPSQFLEMNTECEIEHSQYSISIYV